MARIVFYCHDSLENIELFEYYKQDVDALKALGHEVLICTSYRQLPARFDAVFIWWWTHALFPVLWARARGRPAIVTGAFNFRFPRGFEGVDYFGRPAWQKALIEQATKRATFNIFINETELRECTKHFGLKRSTYLPLVLSDEYLRGPAQERELCIFNLAWSGRKNLIRKGIPELLGAVALLKDEFPQLRLKLAGREGDGVGFLREQIEQLGLGQRVELLGPLSKESKIELLRRCELYVQPSHYETFGLAMAEAMGSGACVVTCAVGGVPSVVGDCGIYVAPGSAEDLARGIREALADEPRRRSLQSRALQRARQEFVFEAKVERLRGCLQDLGIV